VCRDRLQQLTTTTTTVPLFHVSESGIRGVDRAQPPVDLMCHRVPAAGCCRGVYNTVTECTWPAASQASHEVNADFAAPAAHHLCRTLRWPEVCGEHSACGRARRPLRVTVTVTHFSMNFYTSAVHNIAFFF